MIIPMHDESQALSDWYCLRTGPRQEAIAAAALRQLNIEVFAPRIRFQRIRTTGVAWVNEALFPGYLFARFLYEKQHRQVASMHGVIKIVTFGKTPHKVDPHLIAELRTHVLDHEVLEVKQEIAEGDEVSILHGPFSGVRALVSRLLPSRERIAILLQLLGEEREIEVVANTVFPTSSSAQTTVFSSPKKVN